MLKEAKIIEDWLDEAEARGRVEGETEGETKQARRLTLLTLQERYGRLPSELDAQIRLMNVPECEALMMRAVHAASVEEL